MALLENKNQVKIPFLTVVWLIFTGIAVLTYISKYDAGIVGIISWVICIGGIILALLSKFLM